jgi:hypothetical protein
MSRYNLKYKTFDQLLAEVKSDFDSYNLEDLIKPEQLIKVAKRVNYELGLRINQTKNEVLEVEHGRVKLPNDFMTLNFMYVLGNYKTVTPMIQGTHVEEVPLGVPTYQPGTKDIDICATPDPCPVEKECPDPCQAPEPCGCKKCNCQTWINCKGDEMQLIQKVKMETREWSEFYRIRLVNTDETLYDPKCPNNKWMAKNTAFIRDGYVYTSFKEGKLYVNYQGMLEDEHGSLLVLDHDGINDFYEYAIKDRILENLLVNGETVTGNAVQLIAQKLRAARNHAYSIVNTPDYKELKDVWLANRKALFHKYYDMFI